jgi:hypothetical protein
MQTQDGSAKMTDVKISTFLSQSKSTLEIGTIILKDYDGMSI